MNKSKEMMQIVSKGKKELKSDKLEFNTYFIFTEEKQYVNEAIGLMFKDYLEFLQQGR